MSVGFIEEEDKEETVPVTVSFSSGENKTVRIPTIQTIELFKVYLNRTSRTKQRFIFASATGVVAFDLSQVSKIEVVSKRGCPYSNQLSEAL